ncbi:TSUP family transporter [Schleiferia thermophila]|jgi:hypothetical protein|uniref:TSUP family transporter n=1 Tax=Schleiferia thermophila TaxID=884107 RepID=UPI0004E7B006|nr:TSUP family transporter [Schleiferia thermophila]KFD38527.1 hypothetical protein AT05_09450 [Schleiferia thermophila str. Yellowstone]
MAVQEVLLVIVAGVGSFAAGLTVYRSGLPGYLVMLVLFPWFLPLELAIFTASVVHFLDYLVKFSVIRYRARPREVLLFGILVLVGSWLGANVFVDLKNYTDLVLFGSEMGVFKMVFTGILIVSIMAEWANDQGVLVRYRLPDVVAGLAIGVFSGFSGVFESIKKQLYRPEGLTFVQLSAVTIVSSLFSDMARLPVYLGLIFQTEREMTVNYLSLAAGMGSALAVLSGIRYLREVRDEGFRRVNLWIFLVSALGLLLRNFF